MPPVNPHESTDPEDYRELSNPVEKTTFWNLDPTIIFLNHGSFGACPKPVLAELHRWHEQIECDPVDFFIEQLPNALEKSRAALASLVQANSSELVFVPNATTAVNTILKSFPWKTGDEILIGTHAYNACRNALEFVCQDRSLKIIPVELPFPLKHSDQILETYVAAAKKSNRIRLALLDHITSPTGLVFPIESLVRALQHHSIECLVDGAHGPGMVPLNLETLGAEYYTGNAHKWLGAPKGCAFLRVREDKQSIIRPLSISHAANLPSGPKSRFQMEFDWTGTVDPAPWLCLPKAIETMHALHPEGIMGRMKANRALALKARQIIYEALEIPPPAPDSMIATLAAFPLPNAPEQGSNHPLEPSALQRMLYQKHRIQVPVFPWPSVPQRVIRVSCERYNRIEEYETLANLLSSLDLTQI